LFCVLHLIFDSAYRGGYYVVASGLSSYLYLLFKLLLTACIVIRLFVLNNIIFRISFLDYLKEIGIPILLLTFWHVMYSMYVGDRSPAIVFSTLLLSIYFSKHYHVKLIYFIIAIILGGTFLTIV